MGFFVAAKYMYVTSAVLAMVIVLKCLDIRATTPIRLNVLAGS